MALEHRFLQLLELPTSAATSKIFFSQKIQDKIFPGGDIHGVVRPDLPEVHPLFKFVSARVATGERKPRRETTSGTHGMVSNLGFSGPMESKVQHSSCWRVQTVAAQLRSRKDISHLLVTSAQSVNASGCGGSLLLVSGGHPLRRLHFVEQYLSVSSFDMLQTASQLRKYGDIPAGVQLWAVENPLSNSVERLERKIYAGAETVILQPPLLVDRFGEWWGVARRRGLMKAARIVVGLPLITSVDNLAFWFELTQTSGKQVDSKLAHFKKIEAGLLGDKSGLATHYKLETIRLIQYIKGLPGTCVGQRNFLSNLIILLCIRSSVLRCRNTLHAGYTIWMATICNTATGTEIVNASEITSFPGDAISEDA